MGAGGMIGWFIVAHFSMLDWIHGLGLVAGSAAGLMVGIWFRHRLRVHRTSGVIGPLIMAGAFALYVYGVLNARDAPLGQHFGAIIGAFLCGAITLAGLPISLAGWFAVTAENLN